MEDELTVEGLHFGLHGHFPLGVAESAGLARVPWHGPDGTADLRFDLFAGHVFAVRVHRLHRALLVHLNHELLHAVLQADLADWGLDCASHGLGLVFAAEHVLVRRVVAAVAFQFALNFPFVDFLDIFERLEPFADRVLPLGVPLLNNAGDVVQDYAASLVVGVLLGQGGRPLLTKSGCLVILRTYELGRAHLDRDAFDGVLSDEQRFPVLQIGRR